MKTITKFLPMLLLITAIACNSSTKHNEETHNHGEMEMEKSQDGDAHNHDNMDTSSTEASADMFAPLTTEQTSDLISGYLKLKNALVSSSLADAQQMAKEMVALLEPVEMNQAIHGLHEDAQHIAQTEELSHAREHFELMSDNIYQLAKAKSSGKTLYKQYCPMAFGNKGAFWLSDAEEIRNPYFGDQMLKCGKVQEVIN